MSRFSRRKSTSSPSYLLSKFAPMTANLSGFSGSRGIFFVSLAGWKEPCASQSLGLGDKAGYLPAMATTRSSIFFSFATTRDSASRLLAMAHSMDFL